MTVDYDDTTNAYFCCEAINGVMANKVKVLSISVDYLVVSLNLENKNCLIIGGGPLAFEKMGQLVNAGALVSVLSDTFSESVECFAQRHATNLIRRPLQSQAISNVLQSDWALVVVASEKRSVDLVSSRLSLARKLWVNVVADVQLSNIVLPEAMARAGWKNRQKGQQRINETETQPPKTPLLVAIDSKRASPLSGICHSLNQRLKSFASQLADVIAKQAGRLCSGRKTNY